MNLECIILNFMFIKHVTFASNMYIIGDLETEDTEPTLHDERFAKEYYSNILHQNRASVCFISTTINVFHFDFLMNAYRSMTIERKTFFAEQLESEASKLTNPAKQSKDKLIVDKMVLISYQALAYAVDNYMDLLNVYQFSVKKYDLKNKVSYVKHGNKFLDQYTKSPQQIVTDNCTIGIVGTVGVQVQWKYPFTNEGRFMKATGKFKFAHDLQLNIDILQIPFKGGDMVITIVISRDMRFYGEAERLFHHAYHGKFRVEIDTVYLPKIAYSVIIKDYSHDSEATQTKNILRCLTQKLVMNINEEGIDTFIKEKPTDEGWDMIDWKYEDYYPPNNSCTVDSPLFFIITYVPTNESVLMGKWLPSSGPYIEETVENSDDA